MYKNSTTGPMKNPIHFFLSSYTMRFFIYATLLFAAAYAGTLPS